MPNALPPLETDKSNSGTSLFANGSRSAPTQPLLERHERVSQLAVAAEQVLAQHYGTAPRRNWMTGISIGGYLTRWKLEKRPELYDGGFDWEGAVFKSQGPNEFITCRPRCAATRPRRSTRRLGSPAARQPSSPAAPVRHRLRARVGVAVG